MEDKKPRVLDILRLVWSIVLIIAATAGIIGLFYVWAKTKYPNDSDGKFYSKLERIGAIFGIIILIVIICFAIRAIATRYMRFKDVALVDRDIPVAEPIIKMAVCFFVFLPVLIIFGPYWILDLIEAVKCKNLKEKLGVVSGAKTDTDTTNSIEGNQYCENCGNVINADAKFCKHCGKPKQ